MSSESSAAVFIREFRIEDYDALIALWNDAGLQYRPRGRDRREKIERELESGKAVFLVAETEGRLVGSVLGTHDGRRGWINRLAVAPKLRHKGIARMLVAEVEKRLLNLGIEIVACLVEDWNIGSIRTFERLGYIAHPDILYLTKRKHPDV